eukprot:scaffold248607_cov31-Tisochrysis_lutea.AAC.7
MSKQSSFKVQGEGQPPTINSRGGCVWEWVVVTRGQRGSRLGNNRKSPSYKSITGGGQLTRVLPRRQAGRSPSY